MLRVLGIDPGLGCTGYAVVELQGGEPALLEAGAIRAGRGASLAERVRAIHADVAEVIRDFSPHLLALESLYSEYRFPRSALQMAHVRGVICLAAAEAGITVTDISPSEVKHAIVGVGDASKEQVQRSVQALFRLAESPRPADVADALAIAVAVGFRALRGAAG